MTDTPAIAGMPCDRRHPYPQPAETAWIDSLEYGDESRETDDGRPGIDPTPIFRAIAAELWHTSCHDQHLAELATDSVLTAHVVAVAAVASAPGNTSAVTSLGFQHSGADAVFNGLRSGGLVDAREEVDQLPVAMRTAILRECLAHIGHGYILFHTDIEAQFLN